jgi:hypothetical protein
LPTNSVPQINCYHPGPGFLTLSLYHCLSAHPPHIGSRALPIHSCRQRTLRQYSPPSTVCVHRPPWIHQHSRRAPRPSSTTPWTGWISNRPLGHRQTASTTPWVASKVHPICRPAAGALTATNISNTTSTPTNNHTPSTRAWRSTGQHTRLRTLIRVPGTNNHTPSTCSRTRYHDRPQAYQAPAIDTLATVITHPGAAAAPPNRTTAATMSSSKWAW